MSEDRKTVLLKATYDILKKIHESEWCEALAETAVYDGTDCDGFCLLNDIAYEMDLDEVL